jgi:hypothetical protein
MTLFAMGVAVFAAASADTILTAGLGRPTNASADGDGSEGFVLEGIEAGDSSGRSVSAAGDVNGDGVDDLIIGAHLADPNERHTAGETNVVFGRTTGFPATLDLLGLLPDAGGNGSAGFVLHDINGVTEVSGVGDVNGDGIEDLIIGARYSDSLGHTNVGASYIVFGRASASPPFSSWAACCPLRARSATEITFQSANRLFLFR